MLSRKIFLKNFCVAVFLIVCILYRPSIVIAQRPNFIIILLDDANKFLIPPEGPSFLAYPHIERIYDEGIRFCDAYCLQPLCNPARYSLYTGMYPHSNGIYSNIQTVSDSVKTFWKILDSQGYHSRFVGKYSNVDTAGNAMERALLITDIDQKNPLMFWNGEPLHLIGNTTRIIDDTAAQWLSQIDTPFILGVGHIGTHMPISLVQGYTHTYDSMAQVPDNFVHYAHDYPSFLYSDTSHYYTDSATLLVNLEQAYEVMGEIDRGVGNLFDTLEARNLLNNTMIIFTNDNGVFYGEHLLQGKLDPKEPVAGIPLFIRYPLWFDPGSVVCKNFVSLSDLCPTILDAAGINPDPFNFQTTSIRKLIEPGQERTTIYYEGIRAVVGNILPNDFAPSWRAVRTINLKYAKYWCDSLTEELYDLSIDLEENTNLVYSGSYTDSLVKMRFLMDSLKTALSDTLSVDTLILSCHIADSTIALIENEILDELGEMVVFPNPATDYLQVILPNKFKGQEVFIDVFDALGKTVYRYQTFSGNNRFTLNASNCKPGIYFLKVVCGNRIETARFEVTR